MVTREQELTRFIDVGQERTSFPLHDAHNYGRVLSRRSRRVLGPLVVVICLLGRAYLNRTMIPQSVNSQERRGKHTW
jgi:hypothetical protein